MQKSKLDLKTILTIVLVIILAIISFVLVVGYIISCIDPKHSITGYSIAISFVGVFATFGGAYLGAKISGNNARELFVKDIKLRDIENHLSVNLTVLEKINDCKKKLVEINDTLDKDNFYYPCNFALYKENIEDVSKAFEEIHNKHINDVSLIINMDVESLYKCFQEINKKDYVIKPNVVQSFLRSYYNEEMLEPERRMWHQFSENNTSKEIIYPSIKGVDPIDNEGINVEDIYYINLNYFENIKKELKKSIKEWIDQYERMEFKSKEDIYNVYKEVRM
ncbi:hypothetical protein K4U66_07135 [Staphylococcus epidermidis]|uniref:hypothetical protein n=1 Tax=Staphylococcus epidermidis TaxID=1282 RepID=UPI00066DA170|nr:hypothetical protein [Staphylococcus epidermidis]KAB2300953.1 hypothetical protein F9B73_11775 [Staphylococcus epidermidis]MCG1363868.1 hypothetical protein [Staphylococcus epidermidis]MCG1445449.1 hypothetical protein [Staphylococcus epidermidis]MCG1470784.1 hypothetical protein [Staphylococcus epidermidis]MCG1553213.1 hypothetical protein [Staphylococcus epidermidis]